jgi:methionyl-tRNA formyltransferase
VLDVPPLGILNVHASLLPRWRGAAPVAAAILAGDGETGATIMRVVRELDAGPILDSARVPIAANDTTGTLTAKIAEAGATLLSEILPRYAAGELTPIDQDDAQATYAPQIKKADALIHWERDDAETIARKVRAYNPWPMAFARLDGQPLRIVEAQGVDEDSSRQPGTIFETKLDEQSSFAIAASRGSLNVRTVQPPGGRAMSAAAYLRGHRDIIGKRFALNGAN